MKRETTRTDPNPITQTSSGRAHPTRSGPGPTKARRQKSVQHAQPDSLGGTPASGRFRKIARPEFPQAEAGASAFSLQMLFVLWGYVTGAGIILLCGLDLALEIPFGGLMPLCDLAFAACGAALLWMSWHTQREFSRFVNSSMR